MRFGGLQALDDVSFAVAPGAVVGLIGPNGSGKTTLMNVISGVYKPECRRRCGSRGRALPMCRRAVCRLRDRAYVSSRQAVRHLTVRENVAVGAMFGREGRRRSSAGAFAKADELLAVVGLDRVGGRRASDLTIPDRKRLEVAKAWRSTPELLLLDEVMAGLNATEIDEALDLLRTVNRRGVALIVVEHVMKAIVSISSTVVVLAEGRRSPKARPRRSSMRRR